MSHYCTLFDSRYLVRGLLMIDSLQCCSPGATVYVLCMDAASKGHMDGLGRSGLVAIGLEEFETEPLRRAKQNRTKAEYCWTCTPALIRFCLERYRLPECTYVDADLYFYRSPEIIRARMGKADVLITPHRFAPYCDTTEVAGRFCVQFMCFRATPHGLTALRWWEDRCLEWCYARSEPGRFGDQKYLDDWPERFPGVHVEAGADTGVAPWNLASYELESEGPSGPVLRYGPESVHPVFYHFHAVKFWRNGVVDLGTNYRLPASAKTRLYLPYIRDLLRADARISDAGVRGQLYESRPRPKHYLLKRILWRLRGTDNVWRAERPGEN